MTEAWLVQHHRFYLTLEDTKEKEHVMMEHAKSPAGFRALATVSAIFGIAVVIVSAILLNQAICFRETYYSGSGYGGYEYYGGRNPLGSLLYGTGSSGSGYDVGNSLGYQDLGYDTYRYHRVITITAITVVAGILQFFVSMILCCVSEGHTKGIVVGYVGGILCLFIVIIVCWGLAFQYRVIYPFYYNNYQQMYQFPNSYSQYNPEGQAYCGILGIDLVYLIFSCFAAGILAK